MNAIHNRRKKGLMAEINIVPYIDVMLVLLVIFMVTAPLLTQGVNVQLPQASSKVLPPDAEEPMIVSVDATGQYFLNIAIQPQQALEPQQLMTQVAAQLQLDQQQHKQRQVYVKGDQAVDYGKVVQAMALLQKAGVAEVGLITQPTDN